LSRKTQHYSGTVSIRPSVFIDYLSDIVEGVCQLGIRNIVLLNAHDAIVQKAEHILTAAGHELFLGVRAVIHKLQLNNKLFTVILQGGVLQHEDLVGDILIRKLKEFNPLVELDTAKKEPTYGVMAMGLSYLKSSHKKNATIRRFFVSFITITHIPLSGGS
jgi:creatinine amidohydrolase/Fe(II)-dependent formamide hydrolase-like protein